MTRQVWLFPPGWGLDFPAWAQPTIEWQLLFNTVQKIRLRAPLSPAMTGESNFSRRFTAQSLLGIRKAFIFEFMFKRSLMCLLNVSPPLHLCSHRHGFWRGAPSVPNVQKRGAAHDREKRPKWGDLPVILRVVRFLHPTLSNGQPSNHFSCYYLNKGHNWPLQRRVLISVITASPLLDSIKNQKGVFILEAANENHVI